MKLRNPWGNSEWKGDWSDKSRVWNAKLKEDLGHNDKNDGAFFMPYDQFCKWFDSFQICFYKDDYKFSSFRFETQKNERLFFEFDITKKTEGMYYFCLNQISKKMFPYQSDYDYASCTMVITKRCKNNIDWYIGSIQKGSRESWFRCDCTAGKYYCMITTPWKTSYVNQITWTSYGEHWIEGQKVENANDVEEHYKSILRFRAQSDLTKFMTCESVGEPNIRKRWDHSNDGFGYFYFENDTKDAIMEGKVTLRGTQNIELFGHYKGSNEPRVSLYPGDRKIICYFTTDVPNSVTFAESLTIRKGASFLKNQIKKMGVKKEKQFRNKSCGITLYILNHLDGVFFEWVNASKNYILEETISFHLDDGGYIEGSDELGDLIYLYPGETKIISTIRPIGAANKIGQIDKSNYRVLDQKFLGLTNNKTLKD